MPFTNSSIAALLTAWLAIGTVAVSSCGISVDASLSVSTTSGDLTGTINATSPNVRQFLGIPYAEPLVGALRFQPPVRYTSDEAINATAFAPSCLQTISTGSSGSVYDLLPELLLGSPVISEDCLYANVYAPLHPVADKLPVFVWIHGGGFSANGANVPYQIPDQWIESTQGHIVVTLNYRLNFFGFPNAAAQPLNVGLLDQRLVVEWTRDNIANFGGDPDRIVLWGQSAGAWSVNYYGYAYPEDPIVGGLIADSGGSTVFTTDPSHSNFTSVAAAAGCGNESDAEAELVCMQGLDAATLQAVYANTTGVSFGPGVDNQTVFANNTERAAAGLVAQIPAIIGTNSREGSGFVALPANGTAPSEADILAGTTIIACPTVQEIQNRLLGGLTTHRYEYTGNFSNISPLPWIGAIHSGELPLIFGTHFQYNGNSTEFEWQVSYAMEGLWLSFAEDTSSDPTYESFTWPEYEATTESMVVFARDNLTTQLDYGSTVDQICS
ncbi:hypothetical protein PFICI_07733 [Pestalotiopsis fici W106-1]|uniref:Carboxylic ester hydrolase n=1 Tax=Pestalotiopsis fici (strain W106-1 / CGMCC3.15140) TaxID=1229662 RepID=W3X2E9_PESFW|nr:uncharacterized protein PFICI_07733 [Pestalotiopsis fici W106-1]ETS80204.1 hypothetical protein PFICI_07733 [Pestalotiopsis fici W106-1]